MRNRFRVSSFALVFLVALTLRLGWVLVKGSSGLEYSDDARAYNDLAVNLVEHHQFVTAIDAPHRLDLPYAQRPPLTPLVLGATYSVFGTHLLAAQILLAVVGALSALLVFELGRHLFQEPVALLAGLITAIYPFFVFMSAVPLTENLAIALYSLLALMFVRNHASNSIWYAAVIGSVLGLATLNRPQILGFLPFLCLLAFVNQRQRRARAIAWLAVAIVCWSGVLAPWAIRNRLVVGAWFPVSLQGGLALYSGNNPYTQTAITALNNGLSGWYEDPRMLSAVSGLSPVEADHRAFSLGLSFITKHPTQAVVYSIQKLGIFFKAYANWVARLSWYPVLAVSLVGFFLSRGKWRELLPVYFLILQTMLTAAVFTSMPRFRAPVEPLFMLMAAYAAYGVWTSWAKRGSEAQLGASSTAKLEH